MRKSTGIGPNMLKLAAIAFSHTALWMICSALTLPSELQGSGLSGAIAMRKHFCSTSGSCSSQMYSEGHLCYILCRQNTFWNECFNTGSQLCGAPCRNLYCRYYDAMVCQYDDCSCIYSIHASPFCRCKNNDVLPTSVPGPGSQYTISNCTNANPTWVLATPSSSTEDTSAPVSLSTSSDFNIQQSTSLQPSKQSTTAASKQSTTVTSKQSTTTTSKLNAGGQVAVVVPIALGVVLLILVILVVIYLCRSGKLSDMLKKPSEHTDESGSAELGRKASNRAQLPEPLVINNLEYSYAYDHWPVRQPNATTVDPTPVTRAGAQVDGQGSVRYVTGGPTTEAGDVHPDFVLERRAGYEEVEIGNDEGSATEVAHSSPGQSLTEGDDHAYFQVYPTRESQRSHNETPGYEEVSVTGTDVQENAASSPYQQLNGATMESSEYQGLKDKADDDLTGEENASSQYQHLNRATLKRFNEGDRQKGNDDYEHLKGESDYDVPRPVGYKTTE